MQLLRAGGLSELNAGGHGMIMADVMIAYKGESFYGDELEVSVFADEVTDVSFDLLYRITTTRQGNTVQIAHGKTGMVCFDYAARKIVPLSQPLRSLLCGVQ
jgi:acyl-CoA thioesterase FadM